MSRTFNDKEAVREMCPLLIGLAGASGSGKTYSALRLATGIQKVSGGLIYYIDTEARRALHYADKFKFRHVEFGALFGPLDYLAAIDHCAKKGAGIIVIDSLSHEHEGPGGVLEMHASELANHGNDPRFNLSAWQKPKSERRKLINAVLQMPINFIFCFRAKEKTKPGKDANGKSAFLSLGWMPIAGEEWIYEMTVHCLFYPGCGGVPIWNPEELGEKQMVKLPAQFEKVFSKKQPMSEDIGEALARWASGGKKLPDNWHVEQAAERVASAPQTPQAEIGPDKSEPCPTCKNNSPRCAACKIEMLFRPSEYNQQYRKLAFGRWQCPQKCQNPKDKRKTTTINALDWHAILNHQQQQQREPGDDSDLLLTDRDARLVEKTS